jgi:hypothetical protein
MREPQDFFSGWASRKRRGAGKNARLRLRTAASGITSLDSPRLLDRQFVQLQFRVLLFEVAERPFVREEGDRLIEFIGAEADSRRDDEGALFNLRDNAVIHQPRLEQQQ